MVLFARYDPNNDRFQGSWNSNSVITFYHPNPGGRVNHLLVDYFPPGDDEDFGRFWAPLSSTCVSAWSMFQDEFPCLWLSIWRTYGFLETTRCVPQHRHRFLFAWTTRLQMAIEIPNLHQSKPVSHQIWETSDSFFLLKCRTCYKASPCNSHSWTTNENGRSATCGSQGWHQRSFAVRVVWPWEVTEGDWVDGHFWSDMIWLLVLQYMLFFSHPFFCMIVDDVEKPTNPWRRWCGAFRWALAKGCVSHRISTGELYHSPMKT